MPRMPSRPTSSIPEGWDQPALKKSVVEILDILELLFRHLTPTLCETVFDEVRQNERDRKWSLEAIARFWTAMIVRHPPSLTHGVAQTRKGGSERDHLWPRVQAEVNAFFEKCWALRPDFFRGLFEAFTQSLLQEAPEAYARWMMALREHFPQVVVVDGSQLDIVANRLKLLWPVRSLIIPGCVTVFYDLFRGISRRVVYYPNAAEFELVRAQGELDWIARGSLVLGDRLYSLPQYFHVLAGMGLYGLFRKHGNLKIKRLEVLSAKRGGRQFLEDVLVEVGCGSVQREAKLTLRLIRFRGQGRALDLLTSVLDPKKLTAAQAIEVYGLRWTIERMFLDMKKTLKLHGIYATHPNLVAQQVYATAMVYNAFRVAQAHIAARAKVLPEQLSSEKLFPILALCSHEWAISQRVAIGYAEANPGVQLKEPDWRKMSFAFVELGEILLQRRSPHRRRRRRCESRERWKSFAHVPGGPTLIRSGIKP